MTSLRHLAAVLALAPALIAGAQQTHSASSPAGDAVWMKSFAAPCSEAPCPIHGVGNENRLSNDRRLHPSLQSWFHQKEWFFSETHNFMPVADIVSTFIGVPGSAILDADRYVTADGCVPHTCDVLRGMLWVDTGSHPATAIFAATDAIDSVDYTKQIYADQFHLWLFVSNNRRPATSLPPQFLTSLKRWHEVNEANGYKQDIALVTIVQPNGGQLDITYSNLFTQRNGPGAKQ
ncbi:MAG TPA: hypothetical protein VII58_09280 [Acidobacteriaceae bacterium]